MNKFLGCLGFVFFETFSCFVFENFWVKGPFSFSLPSIPGVTCVLLHPAMLISSLGFWPFSFTSLEITLSMWALLLSVLGFLLAMGSMLLTFVNLTQTRVIWEEGPLAEEFSALDWLVVVASWCMRASSLRGVILDRWTCTYRGSQTDWWSSKSISSIPWSLLLFLPWLLSEVGCTLSEW